MIVSCGSVPLLFFYEHNLYTWICIFRIFFSSYVLYLFFLFAAFYQSVDQYDDCKEIELSKCFYFVSLNSEVDTNYTILYYTIVIAQSWTNLIFYHCACSEIFLLFGKI